MRNRYLYLLIIIVLWPFGAAAQDPLRLILPTSNTAFFDGCDSIFYQRTATGRAEPWQGGKFGFVRNPRTTKHGVVYTRHHAGMDVRPLYRDAAGRPLDTILAVADGLVVHASHVAGQSNYGRYMVIRHIWDGLPYYSLYAHLDEIWAETGTAVKQGDAIARMGYTGDGINRARAHLHFEINLLLNENFQQWYSPVYPKDSNYHGIYNGINMAALDVARLYMALRENPELTIAEFMQGEETFFEVMMPGSERPDLLGRYPWLLASASDADPRSWKISFNRSGVPLRITPLDKELERPEVAVTQPSEIPYRLLTKSLLSGTNNAPSLSHSGARYLQLIMTQGTGTEQPTLAIEPEGEDGDAGTEADEMMRHAIAPEDASQPE